MAEIVLPSYGSSTPVYPTFADFPVTATAGQLAIAADTDYLYVFDGDLNTWSLIGPSPSPAGGDMITVTGNSIAVDLAAVSGLQSTNPGNAAGKLQIKLESSNSSLAINGSNELVVVVDPAAAIVKNAGGIGVKLEASNPSLQIVTNELGVKLDPALAIVKGVSGVGVNLETSNPTLQITTNKLGVKLNSGGALTAAAGGVDVVANGITNAKLAQAPTLTLKGNNTGSTANVTDLSVSQVQTLLGIPGVWQTYTPTITGFGSVTAAVGSYKQFGDTLSIKIMFTAGTVTGTLASFSLPGGFNLSTDVSKIPVNNTTVQAGQSVGTYFASNSVSTQYNFWNGSVVTAPATSTTLLYVGQTVAAIGNPLIPAAANVTSDSGGNFSLFCEVILA